MKRLYDQQENMAVVSGPISTLSKISSEKRRGGGGGLLMLHV